MKKIVRFINAWLLLLCLLCIMPAPKAMAAQMHRVIVDANGGLFYFAGAEYGYYDSEFSVEDGSTIAGAGNSIAVVGYAGMAFKGWSVFNAGGAEIASGLSNEDVNGYAITESVSFVAQWEPAGDGGGGEAITYAAWFGETNEVDYGCKITIIHDGVKYSGYGYVSISMDICSSWTGTVQVIQEFPGHFVNANNRWNPDYFSFEGSARSFRKEGDCSFPMSTTGTGRDVPPNSILLREFYYNVRNHTPDISLVQNVEENKAPSVSVTTDSPVVPEAATVHSEALIAGSTYDKAIAAVRDELGTTQALVYGITMKDSEGKAVSQFEEPIEVAIVLPETFVIGEGKTAVVYYLSPDGLLEECDTTYHINEDGSRHVTFLTDHFSCYILVECDVEVEPETSEAVETSEAMEMTEAMESTKADAVETEEGLRETNAPTESDPTSPAEDTRSDNDEKGGSTMAGILIGVVVLIVILGIFLIGKKKNR